ncbi:peptidase, M56 family [Clostridiales bacterium oral taxon 876 str. F0540]|nr:peptidase, M56 family [Clostridiales bacterium oral taxon 876 str. F0540]
MIFISIITAVFKKKLSSSFQYYIWIILVLRLIYPFGPKTDLSLFTTVSKVERVIINTDYSNKLKITPIAYEIKENEGRFAAIDKNIEYKKSSYMEVLSVIWGYGVLIAFLYISFGFIKISKLKKDKSKLTDIYDSCLEKCCLIVGLKEKVDIVFTDKTNDISVVGVIKPTILIPLNLTSCINLDKFKLIILHELVHVKRKDLLLSYLRAALVCIYWFNPIIIYGLYRMRQACEISCDAYVLSLLNDDKRLEYGNTIIDLAEMNTGKWAALSNGLRFIDRSNLKRRVMMVKKYKKISRLSVLAGVAVIIIVGALGLSNSSLEERILTKSFEETNIDDDKKLKNSVNELIKEKIDSVNKVQFYQRLENDVNEDLVESFKFNRDVFNVVRLEDMPEFSQGKFGRFNDYSFCQKVIGEVSNAVIFPVESFKHILFINKNNKEIYFAYKDPSGANIAVRFELNNGSWQDTKTLKAEGKKLELLKYDILKEL